MSDSKPFSLLRLRVATEYDPGVLPRLLGYLTNLNVTPRRVQAEFATTGLMYVEIDVVGLSEARLTLIAGKIAQLVPVVNSHWCRI
jgi:hypothetical protein